jgi:hypothetical protein
VIDHGPPDVDIECNFYFPLTFELSTVPEKLSFMPFDRIREEEYTTYLRRI